MDDLLTALFGATLLASAAVARWYGNADRTVRRLMRAAPRRAYDEVQEGEWVRVEGRTWTDAPLLSPLTDRRCVCWQVVVWSRKFPSAVLLDEAMGSGFEIVDTAGNTIRVDASDLRGFLGHEQVFHSGAFQAPQDRVVEFLAARGVKVLGPMSYRELECRERVCLAEEQLVVVGEAHWDEDPEQGARPGADYRRSRFGRRLVIRARRGGKVYVSSGPNID